MPESKIEYGQRVRLVNVTSSTPEVFGTLAPTDHPSSMGRRNGSYGVHTIMCEETGERYRDEGRIYRA